MLYLQRDDSSSGTDATIVMKANGGYLELYVSCPYTGQNEFTIRSNTIAGVKASVRGFSGPKTQFCTGILELRPEH